MTDALLCSGLHKRFGAHQAIQDVSFTVEAGTVVGLLGPNGAGKTTLIRMILDFFHPDSGEIRLFGEKPAPPLYDRVGYLPEERGLYRRGKVLDVLEYMAELKGVARQKSRPFITQWLERVGLGAHMHKRTAELSKGMNQKVQLLTAIVHQPAFLILDEPFSGLDPLNVQMVLELIEEQKRNEVTLLISTHQMELAERLCHKLVMVSHGKRVLYGSLQEIQAEHALAKVHLVGPDSLDGVLEPSQVMRLGPVEWNIDCLDQDPQSILQRLVAAGLRIEKFSRKMPTLEDVFLSKARATP